MSKHLRSGCREQRHAEKSCRYHPRITLQAAAPKDEY